MTHKRWMVGLVVGLASQWATAQDTLPLAMPANIAPKDRICFALYTVHENTLKLTAQFYPIRDFEPFDAVLQTLRDGTWQEVAAADIHYPGYTATFRVDAWDDSREWEYRVVHNNAAFYQGIVRKNPKDRDEIVMAALTCNSIYPQHGGDISRSDIVENLKKVQPDLLFFSGDQVYDHSEHYLHWLKFGRDFGDIIRNTPTITIPDDHDVGQGNIWGAGGKRCFDRNGGAGGYYRPVAYVQEVERAQTSHLPDPYDPTPIERGIGVYYTDLAWGGISFAILEDRKWKTGPGKNWGEMDNPDAVLLGERQLKFLEDWTTDWEGAEMKSVLSQTIFAQGNNRTGRHDQEIPRDADTNGWPKHGRDKALRVIRKSYSCMVAGDQHLGTVIHHGIDDWGDAGYSFCTPAIANYWMRWWDPPEPGKNRQPDAPRYTGDFLDGFGNHITMLAAANPTVEELAEGGKLSTRAAGYGIVRYNKPERTITFECWPRNVDITTDKQYEGWPITITQQDNFVLKDGLELPTLKISEPDQVVTVLEESTGETVSSLRVHGTEYQPKVLRPGSYALIIGEGAVQKKVNDLPAAPDNEQILRIDLPANR